MNALPVNPALVAAALNQWSQSFPNTQNGAAAGIIGSGGGSGGAGVVGGSIGSGGNSTNNNSGGGGTGRLLSWMTSANNNTSVDTVFIFFTFELNFICCTMLQLNFLLFTLHTLSVSCVCR